MSERAREREREKGKKEGTRTILKAHKSRIKLLRKKYMCGYEKNLLLSTDIFDN